MIYAGILAILCFALRLLSFSGAIAAAIVGGLIWEAGRWAWAIPLLVFFVTSSILSHIGKGRKRAAGLDSRPRRASQVLANGGAAAFCAAMFFLNSSPHWAAAALAGLAVANADTWATEIGSLLGKRFFRISNLKPAAMGISGAVSLPGLLAAFLGSSVIAAAAPLMELSTFYIISVIGFGGSLLDSLLGDRLQKEPGRPGGFAWMTNDLVNLIATVSAAFAGYWLAA